MNRQRKIAVSCGFVLALCGGPAWAQDAGPPDLGLPDVGPPEVAQPDVEAPEAEQPEAKQHGKLTYWLLEEFDWGDDEEVVAESILFDPYFSCTGTRGSPCTMVSTVVDMEKLLVSFQHHEGELWQVVIFTPDLDTGQARVHLPRVWQRLVDYVTRMRGEPTLAVGLPALGSLEFGPPQPTHFWAAPDLEVRIMFGRRDVDRFYVGAFFSDPVRGKVAREAYEDRRAQTDARLRAKRAAIRRQTQGQGASP